MNNIHAHLNDEKPHIFLGTEETNFGGGKYRNLHLGSDLNVYVTDEQLEAIFDTIDKALHAKTVDKLEETIADLEEDLREANELNTQYRVKEIEERIGH